jgi:hypothetical protein
MLGIPESLLFKYSVNFTEVRKCTQPGKSPTLPACAAGRYMMNKMAQYKENTRNGLSKYLRLLIISGLLVVKIFVQGIVNKYNTRW